MTHTPAVASTKDLPSMPLAELRQYRVQLRSEEDSVSYWRRVLHGRIDLLRKVAERGAGEHPGWLVGTDELGAALKDTATGRSRLALMRIGSAVDLPELPGLNEVWARDADPANPEDVAEVLAALDEAVGRVGDYRGQILKRIDAATNELVSRYKDDPDACLDLID
ncbi:RsiG family protein [Tessaracoccus sp.]